MLMQRKALLAVGRKGTAKFFIAGEIQVFRAFISSSHDGVDVTVVDGWSLRVSLSPPLSLRPLSQKPLCAHHFSFRSFLRFCEFGQAEKCRAAEKQARGHLTSILGGITELARRISTTR